MEEKGIGIEAGKQFVKGGVGRRYAENADVRNKESGKDSFGSEM